MNRLKAMLSGRRAEAMIRRAGAALIFGAVAASAGAPTADAAVYNYVNSTNQTQLNCAQLLIDSSSVTISGTTYSGQQNGFDDANSPYLFYVLNNRADIRPTNWSLHNPLAPTSVSSAIHTQYTNAYPASANPASPPAIGSSVTPNMAAYWQINLPAIAQSENGNPQVLRQYQLLVINSNSTIGLNRAERELLRNYVDEGGTLWIEASGTNATSLVSDGNAGSNTPGGLFFDVQFQQLSSSGTEQWPVAASPGQKHPVLTTPFLLNNAQLQALGVPSQANGGYLSDLTGTTVPDADSLVSVLDNAAHSKPYIAAGDYGCGHVIIDNANILGAIAAGVIGTGPDEGYCPTSAASLNNAPAHDLEFVVNLINWATNTSTSDGANPRRNGAQNQVFTGTGALVDGWVYPGLYNVAAAAASGGSPATSAFTPSITPFGSAVYGNVAYVTSLDSDSTTTQIRLHAFDLAPSEDLTGSGSADNGDSNARDFIDHDAYSAGVLGTDVTYAQDYSHGLNYDQLWATQISGAPATRLSPPVVASMGGGGAAEVLVEDDAGKVHAYTADASPNVSPVSQIAVYTPPAVVAGSSPGSFSADNVSVPAPTYFHGWLIAPQPTISGVASVFLYYLPYSSQSGYTGYNLALPGTGAIVCSPSAAAIPDFGSSFGGTDFMCYVATPTDVFALFLGSRDEQFNSGTVTSTGYSFSSKYSLMQGSLGGSDTIVHAAEDSFNTNPGTTVNYFYTYLNPVAQWTSNIDIPMFRGAPDGTIGSGAVSIASLSANDFASTPTAFGDYDLLPTGTQLPARTDIVAPQTGNVSGFAGSVQGIAVGPDNVLYMTVNEGTGGTAPGFIEAVQEQNPELSGTNTRVKWRYVLEAPPSATTQSTNTTASDNPENLPANITSSAWQFVGAPVADGTAIYALAYNNATNQVQVMAFNTDPVSQISLPTLINSSFKPTVIQTSTNEPGAAAIMLQASQTSLTGENPGAQNDVISINNYSGNSALSYNRTSDLDIGSPVTVAYTASSANSSATITATISANGYTPLGAWDTPSLTIHGTPGPLRKIGNTLYFGAGTDTTTGRGVVGYVSAEGGSINKFLVQCGSVGEALTGSGNTVVMAGGPVAASGSLPATYGGIEGAPYALTMVADSNRLIELAPDGSAVWALDSTTEQSATGLATQVSLNRPGSIKELSHNDILFADTGNSRCVRVDRGGNVLWELTSFADPGHKLMPGQPNTLNHPNSVSEWVTYIQPTANADPVNAGRSYPVTKNSTLYAFAYTEHYLITDTNNFRVVEVDQDYVYPNGGLAQPFGNPILVWVTHTFDAKGRQYRYVSADRYPDSSTGNFAVIAGVANAQVALVGNSTVVALDAPGKDAAGSCVVLTNYNNYDNPGTPVQTNSYTGDGLPFNVISQVKYLVGSPANAKIIPIRNLHSAQVYYSRGDSKYNIMVADDDGVFDGVPSAQTAVTYLDASQTPASSTSPTASGFSFTLPDYTALIHLLGTDKGQTSPYPYPDTLFTPMSAVRLANGDYLLANGGSQGSASPFDTSTVGASQQSGGNVIEITPAKGLASAVFGHSVSPNGVVTDAYPTGPGNAAPLSQPSFATRPQ